MTDEKYMTYALELAKRGQGQVSPNPLVGALIVKDSQIIGEGYHEKYGGPHAEVNAFSSLKASPEGATMYVTLEPCAHDGKTPPCVDKIIESGISRVVIGSIDPNPLVAGKSVEKMREANIAVEVGVLKAECDRLNAVFFHYITTGTPFVTVKYAMSADGKIATHTGESKWITGELAREHVHRQRHLYSAIMVGATTVTVDDPMLDSRIPGGKNPIRIVIDTTLRIPFESKVVQTAKEIPTIIVTSTVDRKKEKRFKEKGCEFIVIPDNVFRVELIPLMKVLAKRGIDSIFIEGGSYIHGSAIEDGIVNRVQIYIAPLIIGGREAPSPIAGIGAPTLGEGTVLTNPKITQFGDDFLIESDVVKGGRSCSQES